MLNNDLFDKNYFMVCGANSIAPSVEVMESCYGMLKNKFTDDEFERACEKIVEHEDLYGKPPTTKMFFKHRGRSSENDVMEAEKQTFLNDVGGYLSSGYIWPEKKLEFLARQTQTGRLALQSLGGISMLWRQVQGDDATKNAASFIQRDLGKFYEENYKAEKVFAGQIENEKVKELVSNLKIGGKA